MSKSQSSEASPSVTDMSSPVAFRVKWKKEDPGWKDGNTSRRGKSRRSIGQKDDLRR